MRKVTDEYRTERMEGMRIDGPRHPYNFSRNFTRKDLWAVTVAKMYMASLRTGQVPNYPSEPDTIKRTGWL